MNNKQPSISENIDGFAGPIYKMHVNVFNITRKFTRRASKRRCVHFAAVWRDPGVMIRRVLFAGGWREPGVVCYHI